MGTEKIDDTFGTAASATMFSPNTVFTPTTDTLGTRTSRTMNGYIGGLLEGVLSRGGQDTSPTSGQRIFWSQGDTNSDPLPLLISVNTSSITNKANVLFKGEQADGVPSTLLFLTNPGDGTASTSSGHSALIDDLNFGIVDQDGAVGELISDGASVVSPTEAEAGVATVNFDGASSFGVTSPCVCAFLNWGVWSVNYVISGGTQQRTHLAGWVSGDLADLTSSVLANQPTGTATYLGHMYGTVLNNGAIYVASGVYLMQAYRPSRLAFRVAKVLTLWNDGRIADNRIRT